MMTALCDDPTPAAASAWRICGSDSPPSARPPTCRKSRRETPSQNGPCGLPAMVSIGPRFRCLDRPESSTMIKQNYGRSVKGEQACLQEEPADISLNPQF